MLRLFYFGWADELVYGQDASDWIRISAVSGGGRGQKHGSTLAIYGTDGSLRNTQRNPAIQAVGNPGEPGSTRGGPIPSGIYNVGTRPRIAHAKFGANCAPIFLTMLSFNIAVNTGSVRGTEMAGKFFFHGRGELGSDGCIVPTDGFKTLIPLLDALDAGAGGRLRVIQSAEEIKRLDESDAERAARADQFVRTA